MNDYFSTLEQYATFAGRARRQEFWTFNLISLIFFWGFAMIHSLFSSTGFTWRGYFGLLSTLYLFAAIIPTCAVTVRRLHDVNWNGWWFLTAFIPILFVLPLLLALTDGNDGPNRWGENSKR